jgi:Protein of unknown function (DUF2927)
MVAQPKRNRLRLRGLLLAGMVALPACSTRVPPPPAPETMPAPPPRTAEAVPGGEDLRSFYASIEHELVASGRMRRDVAPADVPFSVDDLVRDFEKIALYDEYTDVDGTFVHRESLATLRRWDRPVRVAVMSGASTPPEDAARDRANVAAFTRRLTQLTGVDVAIGSDEDVNFLVLFMTSGEREAFADQVSAYYPDFAPAVMKALRDTPLDTFCTAYAFSDPAQSSVYSAVIVLIRAEHPPLTRLSCVNEEMAQAMGLPNDSREARPSLFNDTLEFALLTDHDAMLLRMLYDPRLKPGMSLDEVRPLLPEIARDAMAAQRDETVVAAAL